MNQLPVDWSAQLQGAYPKRSGPCGWAGMRLMLQVRRALQDISWEQLIEKAQEYKSYCQASSTEGTAYVLKPESWLEQGIYLEELTYQKPQTAKEAARADADSRRTEALVRLRGTAQRLGVPCYPHDSVEALETRIRGAEISAFAGRTAQPREREGDDRCMANRVASLTQRLKVASK